MNTQFTEKQVDIKGDTISYWEGGLASNSIPILFLPGWSVSCEPYQESLNALAEHYHIIAPTLPGFGKSTSSKYCQNYQDYADRIIVFLDSLNFKKVHIIGHSMGGAIAIMIAASKPSLVTSLIVVDSTGIPLGTLPEILGRRSIELTIEFLTTKIERVSRMAQSFFNNCLLNTGNVIQSAGICLEEDIRSLLPQIQSPCLIVWAQNDRFTPLKMGQEFSQSIKASRLIVVEDEYHELSMFRPEKFVPIILGFIDEVETLK